MKFLISHGEKLVCAIVVVLCGYWIFTSLSGQTAADQQTIRKQQQDIKAAIETNKVDSTYVYHESKATAYASELNKRVDRASQLGGGDVGSFTFYPRPDRPAVEVRVVKVEEKTIEQAVLAPYSGLKTDGQQGLVLVTCTPPPKPANFVPIRIEVQRGTAPDKFEKIIHVVELAPEIPGAKVGDDPKKGDAVADSSVEKSGTTARSAHKGDPPAAGKKDGPKAKNDTRFEDVAVTARTTYYYRARLVARLDVMGPDNTIIRDNKPVQIVVPDTVEKIPGKIEGTFLYASAWSPVAKATVPADFSLRYQFVNGTIPADPRAPQKGYEVNLLVRLWDAEERAWSETSCLIPVKSPVKGKLSFKVGAKTKVREFDTGLVIDSVKQAKQFWVERRKEAVTEEKTDENGEKHTDPVMEDGKPKTIEKRFVRSKDIEVLILKVGDTEKELRVIQAFGYDEQLPDDVKIVLKGEAEPTTDAPQVEPKKEAVPGKATEVKPAAEKTVPAAEPVKTAPTVAPATTKAAPAAEPAKAAPTAEPAKAAPAAEKPKVP